MFTFFWDTLMFIFFLGHPNDFFVFLGHPIKWLCRKPEWPMWALHLPILTWPSSCGTLSFNRTNRINAFQYISMYFNVYTFGDQLNGYEHQLTGGMSSCDRLLSFNWTNDINIYEWIWRPELNGWTCMYIKIELLLPLFMFAIPKIQKWFVQRERRSLFVQISGKIIWNPRIKILSSEMLFFRI